MFIIQRSLEEGVSDSTISLVQSGFFNTLDVGPHFKEVLWYFIYRVAHKNRTAYFPQYVDALTGISV